MSQPQFQQQPQPGQHPYNPYAQSAPVAAQPPAQPQPGPPYQAPPVGRQPNATGGGHPVGAVFLAFFASFVISLVYTGVIVATFKDQSKTVVQVLYVGHALVNGLVVGALAGLVGRRSSGARIGAAVIAPLGAFFGYANAVPFVIAASETPSFAMDMLTNQPFFPAVAWWGSASGTTWASLLGLAVAAAAAWGLAHATGNRGRAA